MSKKTKPAPSRLLVALLHRRSPITFYALAKAAHLPATLWPFPPDDTELDAAMATLSAFETGIEPPDFDPRELCFSPVFK